MSIQYKIIEKGKPGEVDGEKLFYAIPILSGETKLKRLIKKITNRSTVNGADIKAVIHSLLEVSIEELEDGQAVRLEDFGSFRVSFSCKGKKRKEDITPADITDIRIIFKPGDEMKEMFKSLDFKEIK